MTRAEFIRAYARRSGLAEPKSVGVGLLDVDGHTMVALPCGCGEEGCEGWAMLYAALVPHHLFFNLPEPAGRAYRKVIEKAEATPAPGGTE